MKTLKDFNVEGKRVLVRCDFNVPVDENGNITEDFKIQQTIPTIKYLIDKNAKIILMAHFDPESTDVADKKYSFDKVAGRLSEMLGFTVQMANDCIGPEVEKQASELELGKVLMLENLRFHKEETENDAGFAQSLAKLADIYVNEAFPSCHRNHSSIVGVPKLLPHCAGILLEKEIISLDKVIQNPEKPMVGIVGGTKVGIKAKVIDKISEVADTVIVSGLIKKEIEEKNLQMKNPEKIIGPEGDLSDLDINEETIKIFSEKIKMAKTVLWNGPFGKFEDENYAKGTLAIAQAIIDSGAFSVVGGGETVEFITKNGMLDKFSFVSSGGGAMLSYLAGEKLPGLEALR
jgi:3-phosphoglycerate kinase